MARLSRLTAGANISTTLGYIYSCSYQSDSCTSLTVRGGLCWPRGQCAQLGHGRLPFCEICPHKTLHIKQREDKDTSWVARNFY